MADIPIRITGDDDSQGAFKSLQRSQKKSEGGFKRLREAVRDFTIIFTGLQRAIRAGFQGFDKLNDAAKRQADAELGVAIALAKTEKNLKGSLNAMRKWNSEMQAASGVGDEFLFELEAIGANLGQMTIPQLKMATEASLDFSLAMGKDARTAMTALSKLLATGRADFGELGITVDTSRGRIVAFNEAIAKMASGFARAKGELPTEQLQKLKNAFGDLVESIGLVFSVSGTAQVILGRLTDLFGNLADLLRDEEALKRYAKAFDMWVVGTLQKVGFVIHSVLIGLGTLINAVQDATFTIQKLFQGGKMAKEAEQLKQRNAELTKNIRELDQALRSATKAQKANWEQTGGAVARLKSMKSELAANEHRLRSLTGAYKRGGDELIKMGFNIRRFLNDVADEISRAKIEGFTDKIVKVAQIAVQKLRQVGKTSRVEMTALEKNISHFHEQLDLILARGIGGNEGALKVIGEDKIDAFEQEAMAMGEFWAGTFSDAVADALTQDEGIAGALRNIGKNAKDAFLQQMTAETFAPLKESFGIIAKTVALPFQVVGKVINDVILKPIADVASKILSALIKGLLEILGIQVAQKAAMPATFTAVQLAFLPLLATLTSGAAAAAIASFGAATAFGPAAVAQIKALGASALTGYEEGGLVFPQTGSNTGVPIRVAETQPEFVVPLSGAVAFAERMLGASGGGGTSVQVEVNIANLGAGTGSGDVQELADMVSDVLEERLSERLQGGRI